MPNYDRLAKGNFDRAPETAATYPDESRRAGTRPDLAIRRPRAAAPTGLPFQVSGLGELREAHRLIHEIHGKVAEMGNVNIRSRVQHEEERVLAQRDDRSLFATPAARPGALRDQLARSHMPMPIGRGLEG